jgi:hypothetical protein
MLAADVGNACRLSTVIANDGSERSTASIDDDCRDNVLMQMLTTNIGTSVDWQCL